MEQDITQLYKLLMRIGFLAADCGNAPVAEKLFTTIQAAKPNNESPLIGLAYNSILAGKFDEAVTLLRDKALAINPDNHTARAYLGLALGCKGDKEASNKILEEVASKTSGNTANFAKLIPQFLGTAAA
jgi:Flp pilus assembly protein TadD